MAELVIKAVSAEALHTLRGLANELTNYTGHVAGTASSSSRRTAEWSSI
jgi:hypothetical protein